VQPPKIPESAAVPNAFANSTLSRVTAEAQAAVAENNALSPAKRTSADDADNAHHHAE
jgi:hypothetical protein